MPFHSANEYDKMRDVKAFRPACWPAQPPSDTGGFKVPTVDVQRPPPSRAKVKN